MPQMSPINWLSLFIMFSIIFVIICILNYFNFFINYPIKKKITNKIIFNKKYLNWKW